MPYGSLIIKFAADMAEFQKDVKRTTTLIEREFRSMNKAARSFQSLFQAVLIGAGVGKIVGEFKKLAEAADEVGKASQRIGIGAEALQTLTFAAGQSGLEFDELEKGLRKLAIGLGEFEQGTGEASKALGALGFTAEDFKGKNLEAATLKIADKFAVMADSAGKAEIAAKIFGERIGTRLIPFLNEGSEGIRKLQEEAKRLGGVFTDELVEASTRFNDNMDKLGRVITQVKIEAFGPLIQTLADVTDIFTRASTAALTFGEKLKLLFSGEVNQGSFALLTIEIDGLKKELADVPNRSALAKMFKTDSFAAAELEAKIASLSAKREGLGKLLEVRGNLAVETQRPPVRTGAAANIVDIDKLNKEAQSIARAQAALEEARGKQLVEGEQRLAQVRLELLDRFHAKGLIGEEQYWTRRTEVQKAALDASVSAIQREIDVRQAAQSKLKPGSAEFLTAEKEIFEAQSKINELLQTFATDGQKAFFDASDAAQAYRDSIAGVNAQLLEMQGKTGDASAIRFEQQTRALRLQAQAQGDAAGVAAIDRLGAATSAQARFNQVVKDSQLLQGRLALEEERIRNSREVGAISEIRSLQQTSEARRGSLAELEAIAREMATIAEESKNPFLVQQAEAFRLEIEKLATQTDLLADKFDQIGESAFADFLTDVIDRTKSVKDAFKDMADSILRQVNRMAAEEIATKIFGGGPGQKNGFGFGDFMSKLFTGALGTGGAAAGGGAAFDLLHAGSFLASGGPARAGRPYIVGEEGPELFVPDTSGMVVPNGGTMGGGRIYMTVNYHSSGPVDRRSQDQIALAAGRGVNRAITRNS